MDTAQWNHSGCSFTEMFAFIKRNKSDEKKFASQNLYDIFSDLHRKDSRTLICNIS
jgi:hypothetical protein